MVLSGCETIDEERYAGVACQDIKQLMATQNLSTLSQPEDYFGVAENDKRTREGRNLFERLESDKKTAAELRAAYRNNCR